MKRFNWKQFKVRIRLLLLTGALFLVPLGLVLMAVELSFRYVNLSNAVDIPDYTENSTYVPLRIKGNYEGMVGGTLIRTNSHGFRDEPEFDPVPGANEFRVLSIGDSIAFGLTLAAEDAYAKVLERQLNAASTGPEYNIINAAGPGYDPSSYYLFLKNEALAWGLDMVIVEVELTNDVTDSALVEWDVDPSEPDVPVRLTGGRYVTAWDGTLLSAYVRGPYFYEKTYTYVELSRRLLDLLYRRARVKPFPADPGTTYYTLAYEWYLFNEERIESGWQRLLGASRATSELLRAEGIPFLLMVMPSRFVFEGDATNPQREFSRALLDRTTTFAEQNDIPYLDLTEAVGGAGGATAFVDTLHLNQAGNVAVGTALYEYMSAGMLQPTAPR
jgi:lysophospholipase L1-like esterase